MQYQPGEEGERQPARGRKPSCKTACIHGCVIALLLFALVTGRYATLWLLPIVGYGFAWFGHFFIEHNRPATFQYPLYSFIGDWVMLKDFLLGRFKKDFQGLNRYICRHSI